MNTETTYWLKPRTPLLRGTPWLCYPLLSFETIGPGHPFWGGHFGAGGHFVKRGSSCPPSWSKLSLASWRGDEASKDALALLRINSISKCTLSNCSWIQLPGVLCIWCPLWIHCCWEGFGCCHHESHWGQDRLCPIQESWKVPSDISSQVSYLKVFREVSASGVVDLVLITARPGNGWPPFFHKTSFTPIMGGRCGLQLVATDTDHKTTLQIQDGFCDPLNS